MRARLVLLLLGACCAFLPQRGAVVPTERAGNDRPAEAARFFIEQRAYPDGIPSQWHARAMERVHAMENAGLRKGARDWRWLSMGPFNVAGRIRALVSEAGNGSTLYAGSAGGGVWKSTDAGLTWRLLDELLPNLRIGAVAIDPFDARTVLAGCGEGFVAWQGGAAYGRGLYRSGDAGANWAMLASTDVADFSYVFDIAFDPAQRGTLLVATAAGIYRSTDAGATWTRVLARQSGLFSATLRYAASRTGVVYAGVERRGVYRSTDHGVTWSGPLAAGISLADFTRVVLALAPSDDRIVYASFTGRDEQCAGMYRSSDGGENWAAIGIPRNELNGNSYQGFQGRYNSTLTVHPHNADIVWAGGIELYRSLDGGRSWKQMSNWYRLRTYPYVHADIHAIVFDDADANTLYIGSDGGLFVSRDGGASFEERSAGMVTVQFHSGTAHPHSDMVIGGTIDNGTLRTLDGGRWYDVTSGDGGVTAIDPVEPRNVYGELYYLHFLKSTDFGRNFTVAMNGIPRARDYGTSDPVAFIAPFQLAPWDHRTLLAGTNKVYRSVNGAGSWAPISGVLAGDGYISAIGLAANAPRAIWVGGSRGHIVYSNDAGDSWRRVDAAVPDRYVTDFAVHPDDGRRAYVALSGFGGGHVFHTSDGGENWKDVSGSAAGALPDVPVNTLLLHPERDSVLWAGTDVGLFVSEDAGETWMLDNEGIGNVIIADLSMRRDGVLFAATHGRGMYRSNRSILASAAASPTVLWLGQAYPNPVGAASGFEAVIPYTLTTAAMVQLQVVDASGRRVLLRDFGRQDGGDYRYALDMRALAAGSYHYFLRVDGTVTERRLLVLLR